MCRSQCFRRTATAAPIPPRDSAKEKTLPSLEPTLWTRILSRIHPLVKVTFKSLGARKNCGLKYVNAPVANHNDYIFPLIDSQVTLSAAVWRKIAAAQRARWARAKAANKGLGEELDRRNAAFLRAALAHYWIIDIARKALYCSDFGLPTVSRYRTVEPVLPE